MGMTFEEKGAYMELLMMQFNRGHMTTHMIGQTVGQLWVNLQDKFTQDDKGLWFNERLDLEKERRKNFTESRRNNISGENQYTKKAKKTGGHMDGHMTSHMENENVNENKADKLELRKKLFATDLAQYSEKNGGQYPTEMVKSFFSYWTEKNKSGSKMRFEMEKTWETPKRLTTWANRETTTKNKINGKAQHDPAKPGATYVAL